MTAPLVKGDWFRMPSKRLVEVRRITTHEVTLRYLNDDAAMEAGEFEVAAAFLLKHGTKVEAFA